MYNISVIIPTVGEKTLSNVLESLNNSNIKPKEIILSVHNDNYDKVISYQSVNVKILKNKTKGQVSQRIEGFKEAKNDYVLQLDSDIILEKNSIEILIENLNILGDKAAIAPVLKSNRIISNKSNLHLFFKKIINLIIDGVSEVKAGKITKSSIETLPPEYNFITNNIETDWLPGGCVLHRKHNLILDNFYLYEGKAICEDLFHSFYLRKKSIKLYINKNAFATHIDNSCNNHKNFTQYFQYLKRLFKIRHDFLILINGNRTRFFIWFIYFAIKNTLFYFFKFNNEQ